MCKIYTDECTCENCPDTCKATEKQSLREPEFMSKEEIEKYISSCKDFKELKGIFGSCPPKELRVNANCFYCVDCWLSSLEKLKRQR